MKFKALIPILNPLIVLEKEEEEREFIVDTFKEMIKQLKEEKDYRFIIDGKEEIAKVYITKERKETIEKECQIQCTFRIEMCLHIIIDIDIEKYRDETLENQLMKEYQYTKKQIVRIEIENIAEEFKKAINDFRIAINIAFPGFFEISEGYIFIENERHIKIESSISSLLASVLGARKRKWPEIKILNISKTWEWLLKRESFINAMSSNPIERALSSFTHIFQSDNYDDLFYSLIGIEAIYTKGKQGILEQLREKSTLLFGEPENYKNSLSKMYDIRSRFIHGNLNFPSKYYIYDGIKQFDEFMSKEYEQCLEIAEALLVGTIQQFVIRNAESLKFNLQIEFS